MKTEKDESFFDSVVTKTVDGFVVSSSSYRGGKIIFPSKPSLLAVQPKEESTLPKKNKNQKSKSFVVPSWFTKLTQRYVERQKRTTKDSGGLSVFWVDKMGVSTNDTSTGKYIYPNYESRHDLLQKVCK